MMKSRATKNSLIAALYLTAVFIVLIFIATVGLTTSVGPSTCKACHSDSSEISSWSKSSHAKITCAACHVNRGFKGLSNTNAFHFLLALRPGNLSGGGALLLDKDIWSDIPAERCLRCHSPENRDWTVRNGLKMNHSKHIKNDIACVTCHNKVAHTNSSDQGGDDDLDHNDGLSMVNGCWRCHGTREDLLNQELIATLPPGADPPKTCETCHTSKSKKPAFGELNHLDEAGISWSSGTLRHGRVAKKINFQMCFGCHDRQSWCGDRCHNGISMPHNIEKYAGRFAEDGEPPWQDVHYVEASEKGEQACSQCHDSKALAKRNPDFCMSCHHQKFYRQYPELGEPWVKVAMPWVKEHGAERCWECHQPEFCVSCHTTGKKPVPGSTFISKSKG